MTEITNQKKVWLAVGNTDCTEGRGRPLIKFVCDSKATAIRLGRKGSVQGSDCHIEESIAVMIGTRWLVPGYIEQPSREDQCMQEKLNKRDVFLKRLKDAGITDEEIKEWKSFK